ncbi:MAG: IgGFc-binding protein, partial [Mariniphaga sp.]|nr:IgGFc-binding protein [Mariniphaga sp.]
MKNILKAANTGSFFYANDLFKSKHLPIFIRSKSNMRFLYSIWLILFLLPLNSFSQGNINECHKSTEGTDFWFGFMESRNYHNNHYLEITVTSRETTNFTITIGPQETPFNGTYIVNGNSSRQVKIPWDQVEALGSESIQDKGIHLIAEKPVNVYALNWDANSADVAVIYPVESLGTEYFAMCYDPRIHESNSGNYGNGRNSEFLIVASKDSTIVEIIPSVVTDSLRKADSLFAVTLNEGQVYQVQSMNFENLAGQGDLTGSYIKSNKPIAFYSGSLATTIPSANGISAWDHIYEQIPPLHSWGREFYTVPLKTREQDRYRIMASEDNTTINISGLSAIKLNSGEFEEFVFYYNQPKRIFADKPIMVAQYSQSQSVDRSYTGGNGDPFMIILSPISQSKNDVTFVAYDSDQIVNYSVNIITLTAEISNLVLDGQNIQGGLFHQFSGTEYSYAQITINPGTHRIYNKNPDRGFLAYVYGFGGVESYGYGVGFNLDLVLDLGKSINFNGDTLLLCYGDSRILDAGPYFDTYDWNTGDSTQRLTVLDGGEYSVTTTTIDGCILFD